MTVSFGRYDRESKSWFMMLLCAAAVVCFGASAYAQRSGGSVSGDGGRGTPKEFRSYELLSKAAAELREGRTGKARETLEGIEALDFCPRHHRMYASRLETELNGRSDGSFARTPVPMPEKTALTYHVRQSAESAGADGSRERPFPSIAAALRQVRRDRANGSLPEGAIRIVLTDVVYHLESPVILDRADSGTRRNPLIITSDDSRGRTVITGGVRLTEWRGVTDTSVLEQLPESSRDEVLAASLKANGVPDSGELILGGFSSERARGGSHRFKTFPVMELFYKGRAQEMARWPNDGDTDQPLENFTDSRLKKWARESDLWLHGYWYWAWADAYEKVGSIDADNNKITVEPPVNRYGFRDSKWHAVNALCEIDRPGEWHLDTASQTVHYYPPDGFDSGECVISAYGPVFTLSNCDYVTIRNIDMRYVRGDAMLFSNCNDITVTGSDITAASGYGIKIEGGLRYLLHTIGISHMGRGGIELLTGDWRKLVDSGTVIENCSISDLSRIDRTYTPAVLMEGMGIKVRYCLFDNIPSSAIRMEASESIVELSEFTHCVEESDDQGAIDVWGNPLYRRNIIRWNYFHDNTGRHGMVCGVRLDDAISDFMISRNIFLRSSGGRFGGIQIHGGKENYVDGNVIIDCQTGISNSPWGEKRWKESLENHSGIAGHLSSTPWREAEWMSRYPELRDLVDGVPDRNFFAGNRMVNCGEDFLRMSPNAEFHANTVETIDGLSGNIRDIHSTTDVLDGIPVGIIGVYK